MEFSPENSVRIRQYTIFLIVYALFIILWGAFVRLSGSGDGCGTHWPLCHGELIPFGAVIQTWIEFFHRIKSGLFGFLIVGHFLWARRVFPKNHLARSMAGWILFFTIAEALIGASLVLFGWVNQNLSSARVLIHSAHFGNTLLLLASMVFFVVSARLKDPMWISPSRRIQSWCWVVLFGFLFVGITGAWAALTNLIFPTQSLQEGWLLDGDSESPWFVRLRGLHPLFAIGHSALLLWLLTRLRPFLENKTAWMSGAVSYLVVFQVLFGFATMLLLAPTWMKLGHLFIADLIWMGFLWILGLSCLRDRVEGVGWSVSETEVWTARFKLTRSRNA